MKISAWNFLPSARATGSAAAIVIVVTLSLASRSVATPVPETFRLPAPEIVRELEPPTDLPNGVRVRRVVFRSRPLIGSGAVPAYSEVYAYIALPPGKGPFPGILVLHGGKGFAEATKALGWAKRGYVAIAPDLPGIGDPEKMPDSSGPWKNLPYGDGRWNVNPDVKSSTIFEATAAGLQAFKLLQSLPETDDSRLGIIGISWGGYTTTLLAGLLGDEVNAVFSIFGGGHYEDTVFASALDKMSAADRAIWLRELDASSYAGRIKASYFIAAATNDSFFYPPSVTATLRDISAPKNQVFAANADHGTDFPGGRAADGDSWTRMELAYFAYHLKGVGKPLPVIRFPAPPKVNADGIVRFHLDEADRFDEVSLRIASAQGEWKKRQWTRVPATALGGGDFEATLPKDKISGESFWFVFGTDNYAFSVSSELFRLGL